MLVLWIFVLAICFVRLLVAIFWRGTMLNNCITNFEAKGYFKLQEHDFLSVRGYKIVGSVLYIQHDVFGFYTRHYTTEGEFIKEEYYAFTERDTDGLPSDLPADCPESR